MLFYCSWFVMIDMCSLVGVSVWLSCCMRVLVFWFGLMGIVIGVLVLGMVKFSVFGFFCVRFVRLRLCMMKVCWVWLGLCICSCVLIMLLVCLLCWC